LELVWWHCAVDWGSPRAAGIGVGSTGLRMDAMDGPVDHVQDRWPPKRALARVPGAKDEDRSPLKSGATTMDVPIRGSIDPELERTSHYFVQLSFWLVSGGFLRRERCRVSINIAVPSLGAQCTSAGKTGCHLYMLRQKQDVKLTEISL